MKKFANYLMIILIVPALVLSSCKKDSDDEPEKADYLAQAPDLKTYLKYLETICSYRSDSTLKTS